MLCFWSDKENYQGEIKTPVELGNKLFSTKSVECGKGNYSQQNENKRNQLSLENVINLAVRSHPAGLQGSKSCPLIMSSPLLAFVASFLYHLLFF